MRTDQFNVMLIVAILGWVSAQLLKTIIHVITTKKFSAERIFGAGGMPSSHSATVCALAITASRIYGITSPEFALSMVLGSFLSEFAVAELICAGSVMITALGLNLIGVTKIKVANLLPGLIFVPVFCAVFQMLGI